MADPRRSVTTALLAVWTCLSAQENPPPNPRTIGDLSLEQLGDLDITSVLKRPERLSQAPAAVFVITREDIRRSGATTLPDVLRLAPNLQVAQLDSSQYAIGARGFNSSNVNKLLVLIDGRTVYSTLHAGVFWDAQDLLLADIDRIEVISGPGGTLWGSNAVNGVINILTRSAQETASTLATAAAGGGDRFLGNLRHGGKFAGGAAYRVYAKYLSREATTLSTGDPAQDGWHRMQGGFRMDWSTGRDALTFQGDAYTARIDQRTAEDKRLEGFNLVGRWGRSNGADSHLSAQLYLDHTYRKYPALFSEAITTADLDLAHRFRLGEKQEIVWGGGYRSSRDDITNSALLAFLPARKTLHLLNVFGQDTWALLQQRLKVTLGAKLEHNVYTGWEFQPSLRLSYAPHADHMAWLALSRAVRTPSRLDRDFYVDLPGVLVLHGGPDFRSESVVALEAGYRAQPSSDLAWSVSPFYNTYRRLRTFEAADQVLANRLEGTSYGLELWGEARISDTWRLKPGYAFVETDLRLLPGSSDPLGPAGAGNDARHRFQLTSHWSVTPRLDFDGTLRRVTALPNPVVPAYWALNLRLAWRATPHVEISLVGKNLFAPRHPEFGATPVRSELATTGMLRVVWVF